ALVPRGVAARLAGVPLDDPRARTAQRPGFGRTATLGSDLRPPAARPRHRVRRLPVRVRAGTGADHAAALKDCAERTVLQHAPGGSLRGRRRHTCRAAAAGARSVRLVDKLLLSFLALGLGPLFVVLARRHAWSTVLVDSFCVITISGFALLH